MNHSRKIKFYEEKIPRWQTLLLPFYIGISIVYLFWRLDASIHSFLWFSFPLLLVDTYNVFTTIIHLIVTRKIIHPISIPPLTNKTVDVFIPTYNEPEEIVEMTTVGALNITGIRNVFILDDGNRPAIKHLAQKLGANYLARKTNAFAKAGNMNYGLAHSNSEFVLFFDCDHVPQPEFLERTLGFFSDEKLAFVQTPQVFYNTESIQHRRLNFRTIWSEQSMFYESIQPAKNAFNAAFFCGTSAILRRSALDSVGGFATGTATEDIHTSLRLHAKGWNSLFLKENLAFGLAPEDIKEYHEQRVRWGAGSLGLLLRTKDSPFVKKGLSIWQRLCYINSTNAYFYGGIIKLFYILFPIMVILTFPFHSDKTHIFFLSYFAISLPFLLASTIITFIYSRKTYRPIFTEEYNIANIFSCIEALKGIYKIQKKFKVSAKVKKIRENHFVYYGIFALFVILLSTDIFGIFYFFIWLRKGAAEFFENYLAISIFWNSFNLFIVYGFIMFLKNYHTLPKKEHLFKAETPALVFPQSKTVIVKSINMHQAYILCDFIPKEKNIVLDIPTKSRKIRIQGVVFSLKHTTNGKNLVKITFSQLSLFDRKNLIRYFFCELVTKLYRNDFIAVSKEKTKSSTFENRPAFVLAQK